MTNEKDSIENGNDNDNGNANKYNFDTNDLYYQAFYTSIRSPSTAQQWANNLHMYMTFHKMQKYSDMIGMLPETLKNMWVVLLEFCLYQPSSSLSRQ